MKTISSFFLIFVFRFTAPLIFLFCFTSISAAGLNSVFSKDGSDVWAVGLNGYAIHSTNGGISWVNVSLGNSTYNSVCSNNQYVWIAGDGGVFQLSSDNGNSWTQYSLAGTSNLKSVFFFNTSTGWISGNGGIILKTTNSGLNWTPQPSSTINNLNCIVFEDINNGAACGANGTVIITTNGGNNWSVSVTPIAKELLSADMKGNTIYSAGIDASVIKSTNSGNSWSIIDYKIQTKSDVNSVFMTDQNNYYSCGGGGFIRKSADGGTTFTFQINPMLADLFKIFFYNSNLGWAVGRDNNVVLRTTDGGSSWQMPANTTQSFTWSRTLLIDNSSIGNLFALNNYNKNEVFISAKLPAGTLQVFRSMDLGSSWAPISTVPFGDAMQKFIISPKDSSKFLILTDTSVNGAFVGRVLRSTNYGVSWSSVFTGHFFPDGAPMSYDPNHPDTVYLGQTDSLLYRSTDFGLTWTGVGTKYFPGSFCYILVPYNNSNIILCNVSDPTGIARIFRSTDFGLSWSVADSMVHSQEEAPFLAATNFSPNTIYCTYFGIVGAVKKSTNLGLSWFMVDNDNAAWALDVAKDDPNFVVYGDIDNLTGTVEAAVDGSTFSPAGHTNDYVYSVIALNRKIILSQGNGGFYKLNIVYNNPIGISQISTEVPKQFSLSQNYPNPFNPSTKIRLEVPLTKGDLGGFVTLYVYNAIGQEVTTLVNEQLNPGTYSIDWNALNYPSGVYFYKLTVENSFNSESFIETKKMILLK